MNSRPYRPQFHFLAPKNWMNDPNGTIYYQGEYHLFYQHNPFKNHWGSIHWGHAKSKDLVYWEHLPIALVPSSDLGEKHCFSGCCVNDKGTPKIIYTKIGKLRDIIYGAEQWMATSNKDMENWQKFKDNPIMDDTLHGEEKIRHWRDPYIWKEKEKWFCILGGHYRWKRRGVVFLYESLDLIQWQYLGPLYIGRKGQGWNFECPNLIKIQDKHILILSPHNKVIYSIGTSQNNRFQPEGWYYLDHGKPFYATNTLIDDKERIILFGWIKGGGNGWNGCICIPRVLSLNDGNELVQYPIPELERLRTKPIQISDFNNLDPIDLGGNSIEIIIECICDKNASFGIEIVNKNTPIKVGYNLQNRKLFAGKESGISNCEYKGKVRMHIFLDQSIIEMFLNNKECITGHYYLENPEYLQIQFKIWKGNVEKVDINLWHLNPI